MPSARPRLGLWAGIAFAAGAMIGPGFFVLPGSAFAEAGPAIVLSYALAGLLILPAVLSKCELVSAMPRTGGSFVYVERGLGPLPGTVIGGVDWLAGVLKTAFALEGVGTLAALFLPWSGEAVVRLVAVAACLLIFAHFLLGARLTGHVLIGLVGFVVAAVVVYAGCGLPHLTMERLAAPPRSWNAVLVEAGLVCVAFGGVTTLVKVAEEFEAPERTVPRAILWGFGIASCLYLLGVLVTVGVVPREQLAASSLPLALGARAVLGAPGELLVELAALVAFLTAATTGIYAASRTLWAMARDGLAPAFLGGAEHDGKGPRVATALTTLAVASVCAGLSLEDVIKAASAMILLKFVIVELAILVLARSPDFRPQFHVGGQPWLQLVAVGGYGLLLVELGLGPILQTLVVVAASSIWYLLYVARRVRRESALVQLVRRIAGPGRPEPALRPALTSLAILRREGEFELFAQHVRGAPVLELREGVGWDGLVERLGSALAPSTALSPRELGESLRHREELDSTVIGPGLAVPHALFEDRTELFALAFVRCRPGIRFPGQTTDDPPVRAAFAIVCSPDMRHLHLQCLMLLARRCSAGDFLQRWEAAPTEEALRALILPADLASGTEATTPPAVPC